MTGDQWARPTAYERFMGRWSRLLAPRFLQWLQAPTGGHWLDVGCGTGALTAALCAKADPASVLGCDPSEPFIEYAREHVPDPRARFVDRFWTTAAAVDHRARELDEARRFPLCRPEALERLFRGAGLRRVRVEPVWLRTVLAGFEDYWQPLLTGDGPAPAYLATLDEDHRDALCRRLKQALPGGTHGRISLLARSWAVRGMAR